MYTEEYKSRPENMTMSKEKWLMAPINALDPREVIWVSLNTTLLTF